MGVAGSEEDEAAVGAASDEGVGAAGADGEGAATAGDDGIAERVRAGPDPGCRVPPASCGAAFGCPGTVPAAASPGLRRVGVGAGAGAGAAVGEDVGRTAGSGVGAFGCADGDDVDPVGGADDVTVVGAFDDPAAGAASVGAVCRAGPGVPEGGVGASVGGVGVGATAGPPEAMSAEASAVSARPGRGSDAVASPGEPFGVAAGSTGAET